VQLRMPLFLSNVSGPLSVRGAAGTRDTVEELRCKLVLGASPPGRNELPDLSSNTPLQQTKPRYIL
jgi:hypothetical protein